VSESPDAEILWLSAIAACVIVTLLWIGAAGLIVLWTNRRFAELTKGMDLAKTHEPGSVRYLFYALGLMFWVAAVVLAFAFLRKPESASTGRVFVWIAILHFSLALVAAVAIVLWVVSRYPGFLV
jgi:hypothetical protein